MADLIFIVMALAISLLSLGFHLVTQQRTIDRDAFSTLASRVDDQRLELVDIQARLRACEDERDGLKETNIKLLKQVLQLEENRG